MQIDFSYSYHNLIGRQQKSTGKTGFSDLLSKKAHSSQNRDFVDLLQTKFESPYLNYCNYSADLSDINLETENYKISQDEQSGYISIYDKKAGTGVVMRSVQDLAVQKDIATGTKVLIRDFGSGFYCVVRVTDELEGALKKALQTDVLREKELTGFKVHTDQKTGIHYITANGYEGRGGILLLDDQGCEKLVSMAEEYMSQYPQLIKSMDEAIMFAAFEISGVAKRSPNGILKLGPNSLSFYDKNGKDGWQILFDELDYELYRKEWDKGKNTDEIESKGYWESI